MEEKKHIDFNAPDALLKKISQSILAKAVFYSIVLHLLLTGATSIGLVKDWMYTVEEKDQAGQAVKDADGNPVVLRPYFLKAPGTIANLKKEERKAEDMRRRKEEAAEKARKEAIAAQEAEAAAASNKTAKASAPAAKSADGAAAPAAPAADTSKPQKGPDGKVVPPEVQPLPPKKSFEYGEDLTLD